MARQHRPGGFDLHPDTISIKYGEEATPNAPEPGDVVSPIHLATTFAVDEVIDDRDWTEYEAFAAGLSAISATIMSAVEPGDHVVAFEQVYSGSDMMLRELFDERLDVDVSFVDASDPAAVADAMRDETALVWIETPTSLRRTSGCSRRLTTGPGWPRSTAISFSAG